MEVGEKVCTMADIICSLKERVYWCAIPEKIYM
jgi:hypothetical protein